MGFLVARRLAIAHLDAGTYLLEDREGQAKKNKLATGEISKEDVIELLKTCRGDQYEERTHHLASTLKIHVFKSQGWYVKLYFLSSTCVFISVHQ